MNEPKSKLVPVLRDAVISIIILFVLMAGFMFWLKHSAKPTEKFCGMVKIDDEFDDIHALARKQGFDVKESSYSSGDEKIFFVSKPPKGRSSCILYVKDKKIIKKQFVLYAS